MKKSKRFVWNNEFQIYASSPHSHGGPFVILEFEGQPKTKEISTIFRITKKEWENLSKFLKATQNKELLPEDSTGYEGFAIDKNEMHYYSLSQRIDLYESSEGTEEEKQKDIKNEKKRNRGVKRTLLASFPVLEYRDVKIIFSRRRFLSFRKLAFAAHDHFFPKK